MHSNTTLVINGSDLEQVAGILYAPEDTVPSPLNILALHGHLENKQKNEHLCTETTRLLGMYSLALDLRGHGDSSGSPTDYSFDDHESDIISGLHYLEQTNPNSKTILIARSYTAPLAVHAAAKVPGMVAGLVLVTPAIYPDAWRHGYKTRLNTRTIDAFRMNLTKDSDCETLHMLKNCNNPVLIAYSEHDQYIPVSVINAYTSAAKYGSTELINGARHELDALNYAELTPKIISWIHRTLMALDIPQQTISNSAEILQPTASLKH
jgi:pimeloyl-ACP methyl ester carboxylesterase